VLVASNPIYTGELTVTLPTDTGCTHEIAPAGLKLFLAVLGEDANGNPNFRETQNGGIILPVGSATVQFHSTMRAGTDSVLVLPANTTPTSLQKGTTVHRLSVQYSDSFGGASIKTPTLDFRQHVTLRGHRVLQTRAKVTLTDDNRVCLLVANQNQCAPLTQPTLTNGAVTFQLGQLHSTILGETRTVTWPVILGRHFLVATLRSSQLRMMPTHSHI
jgi:hypothetical protein